MQVLVTGPWGSGTTAVTSCLNAAGLPVPGPHLLIDDPLTPNTLEQTEFRSAVLHCVDESTLTVKHEAKKEMRLRLLEVRDQLAPLSPYAIKLPASAFVLNEIENVFAAELELIVVMHRPLEEVEATRLRRGWDTLGAKEAVAVHTAIRKQLPNLQTEVLDVDFDRLKRDPEKVLKQIDRKISTELDIPSGTRVVRQ